MPKPITTSRTILQRLKRDSLHRSRYELSLAELLCNLYQMDATDYLAHFPDNSVQLILTDEPFGIEQGILSFRGRKPINHQFSWDEPIPMHLIKPWVKEAARVLKPGGVLVNCGIASWTTSYENVIGEAGLDHKSNTAWFKTNAPPRVRKGGFRSAYENIWVASKGSIKHLLEAVPQQLLMNWLVDVECPECKAHFPLVYSDNYHLSDLEWTKGMDTWQPVAHFEPYKAAAQRVGHATEKPDWLAVYYLELFSRRGDIVIDPFFGAGTFVRNAARLGRQWSGNEIDPRWHEGLRRAIDVLQPEMI